MGHKFAEIVFTDTVKKLQTQMGSRAGYSGMEQVPEDYNHMLSRVEAEFIMARDSFYMATVGETGWPYIQHRGGPKGFVKIIDAKTIGIADYSGNRQYVSTGNLTTDNRVALFFMDYPNRRRMKMVGRVTIVDPSDVQTLAKLEDPHVRAPIERGFLIHIEGFDWNCPKFITPRYTEEDIQRILAPMQEELTALRNKAPQDQATSTKEQAAAIPTELGEGPLPLVITSVRQEAENIRSYELRHRDGAPLPVVKAGAHIQVPVMLADGETIWRSYSISSDPSQQEYYTIAVLDQEDGRGGSHALHAIYQVGQQLNCHRPDNYFALQADAHKAGKKATLIAGGVGITPIRSMAMEALHEGFDCAVHYAVRTEKAAAFVSDFKASDIPFTLYASSEGNRLDLADLMKEHSTDSYFYICGPDSMIAAAQKIAAELQLPPQALVYEAFDG